jgi:hypothetical protein
MKKHILSAGIFAVILLTFSSCSKEDSLAEKVKNETELASLISPGSCIIPDNLVQTYTERYNLFYRCRGNICMHPSDEMYRMLDEFENAYQQVLSGHCEEYLGIAYEKANILLKQLRLPKIEYPDYLDAQANAEVLGYLEKINAVNQVAHTGKDPNFVEGSTSGIAQLTLPLSLGVKYSINFNWNISNIPKQITEIKASLTGLTLGMMDFEQTGQAITKNDSNTEIRITITGNFFYKLFHKGIGRYYDLPVSLFVIYNATNGAYTLIQEKR